VLIYQEKESSKMIKTPLIGYYWGRSGYFLGTWWLLLVLVGGIFTGTPAGAGRLHLWQDHSTFWVNLSWSLFQKEKKRRFQI
jgi:hypothetical protein